MAPPRIRLQSFAPLPSFRVWFLVPQKAVDVQSLKIAISTQLPALKGLDIRPAQLVLEMDSFELLDETSIDLVREGDIVVVKTQETIILDKVKRKTNVQKVIRAPKRCKLSVSSQEDSSSPSSDSSTSNPSASDSSTSNSSTSSSPDSASENSKTLYNSKFLPSSNIPHISPVARKEAPPSVGVSGIQQLTAVPPGLGKASTHSRNKRRKLKRKYAAAQSSLQTEVERVDGDKLPSFRSVMQSFDQQPAAVSITSRSTIQQNERSNGFMTAVKSTAPKTLDSNSSSSVASVSRCAATSFPPSEREDLPKNLFVTSVEINWHSLQDNKLKPRAQPNNTPITQLFKPCVQSFDWTTIEEAWENYKTLNASIEIFPDTIVGWKGFGLDPATLTPQASMLHLGKVVTVDAEDVLVQPLTRPGVGRATFGRAIIEDQDFLDQTSYSLQEIWSNEWKLISFR